MSDNDDQFRLWNFRHCGLARVIETGGRLIEPANDRSAKDVDLREYVPLDPVAQSLLAAYRLGARSRCQVNSPDSDLAISNRCARASVWPAPDGRARSRRLTRGPFEVTKGP